MSRSGEVTLQFGSEERAFRLTIGAWRKVQEKCDAGPPEIARRLGLMVRASSAKVGLVDRVALGGMGEWRVDDVREPLYQALIGAGMDAMLAGAVIREVIDGNPLADAVATAFAVVMASLVGADDEPASGEQPAGADAPASPAASSVTAKTASTPSVKPAASRRRKSTT